MGNKLQKLEDKILFDEYSDEEWKQLDKELDEVLSKASEQGIESFMESGVGELSTQILEYID